jgi:hypothetical protein
MNVIRTNGHEMQAHRRFNSLLISIQELNMETIIAGRFDTWDQAERTTLALLNLTGLRKEDICTFYNGPPGQHASYPIGGDQDADPEANKAHNKSMAGSAIGRRPRRIGCIACGTGRSGNRGSSRRVCRLFGRIFARHDQI